MAIIVTTMLKSFADLTMTLAWILRFNYDVNCSLTVVSSISQFKNHAFFNVDTSLLYFAVFGVVLNFHCHLMYKLEL